MDGDGDLDAVELTRDSLKFWRRKLKQPKLGKSDMKTCEAKRVHGLSQIFSPRQVGVQDFIEREVKDQDIVETFTVADWDQDGRMDLLFLDMLVDPTDLMRETLSVELWQSGASLYAKTVLFRESESTHFNFTSASRKAAMQLVHWDGRPERSILFTGLADGHQRLLEDEGGGNFTMRFLSQAPLGACVAVDADHDGDSDLYCVDSANVSFHRSIGGEGAFEKVAEVQSPQPGAVCTLQTLSGDPRHQVSLALVCEEDGSFTAYTASGAAEAAIHDLQPMVGWANSPYWPYFVDWDGDGALDAVAERKNIARDGMRLFSLGHCVSPCNGGRCEADGRCSCLPDRALEDCSGCRTEHAMAIDGSCLPCPGFGTLQGTCSRRGRCEDDAFAMSQARGNSSNSSLLLERGSASCDCNPYFSGQDCSLGECPPGMELQEDLGACADCAPGMYKPQAGNWACLRCQAGRFADGPGSELCTPCTSGLVRYTSAAGEDQCEPDTSSVFIAALGMLSCLAGCLLVPILLGTEIPVQDISFKRGQGVLVTTKGPHLIRPSKDGPAVFCEGTGVPVLDRPEARGKLKGIVLDARSLQLCMEDGETLQEAANSSCGWLRMPLRDALLFSSLGSCPILAVVLVQLALFMAAAVYSQLHPGLAALTVLVGLLLSGIFRQFRGPWAARYSLLRKAHRKYLSRLQRRQSRPERTPRGSRRAITLGQLCELQEAFQSFLYDRNMYYICHNIVRPLTEKDKVSFAELSGPHDAQYFVSHYWGTSFQDYIRSIWKQAESSTRGGEKPGFLMQQTAYWICTFAINQWEVLEEVGSGHGNGWQNSSFYLALRSPIKATLMILDEDVIPLTRSWCLFELFQSFQLSAQDPNFQIFFCTQSGVLNHGNCSVDAAMAISDKLVTLRLENASASEEKDKKMIDELIQKEEGGFEAVNAALKMRISEILQATEQHLSVELARLATGLKASLESEETAIEF
ncbi:unnamed protein product [Symbiodinium natans]|uniref:EGF-like domain-containing protein n=1 Tax=Symbiodinium natans TaxID=878477 RepID=A0A812QAR4_9DINO|nr:unnamed protein product [Symbiodinium natans]